MTVGGLIHLEQIAFRWDLITGTLNTTISHLSTKFLDKNICSLFNLPTTGLEKTIKESDSITELDRGTEESPF
jgi:hypothetical protein